MSVAETMERAELQDSARKAFGSAGPVPDAAASWATLADMGWLMMTVPEAQGGLGLGREAAAIIHYELGRALVLGPAIAQMLAIEALASAGQDDLLAAAMSGEKITASLAPASDSNVITAVPDADTASHVLVDRITSIRLVPLHHCRITPRTTWDESRRLFDIEPAPLDHGMVIAEGASAAALRERLQAQMLFALAADSLGAAEAVLKMTIEYLGTRHQFDRPLAMFQALKHRVADLKIAHSAADALLWSAAAGDATLVRMGALKAYCTQAARDIAEEAIQLHGGIGLTNEHPCHLYLKRVFLNCALGGDADHWNEQAGRALMEMLT